MSAFRILRQIIAPTGQPRAPRPLITWTSKGGNK